MIKHILANGVEVIPTSFHGCKFSDGTEFAPTEADIEQIKVDWPALGGLNREFTKTVPPLAGIGTSRQRNTPTDEIIARLEAAQNTNPNAVVLVSFMLFDALRNAGLADRFPRVVAANATQETSRVSNPADKVWDVNNFSVL